MGASRTVLRPVFILGAPRSGTSLLYRALALHSDTAWVSQYVRRVPSVPELAVLNRLAHRMPESRSRLWFGNSGDNAYRYGARRSAAERWFPQPVEGEPVFTRRGMVVREEAAPPSARQRMLADDFRRLARAAGGRLVISKRIGHNRRIPLLHGVFPQARFLVLSRDGRAVARSLASVDWWENDPVWWFAGSPRDWEASGGDPAELRALHWVKEVEAIDAGLSAVPKHLVHRMRYEDLVDDPLVTLREAGDFAGLPESQQWQRALGRLKFPKRNRSSSVADDAVVQRVQEPTLRALGYL